MAKNKNYRKGAIRRRKQHVKKEKPVEVQSSPMGETNAAQLLKLRFSLGDK